jgi:DNA topoisomerase I
VRLRRADPSKPGYGRRRRGKGFTYVDTSGRVLSDVDEVQRIRDLVIPPAWKDVWICPDPRGHIQATGVDAAGRKQYLYHPQWRVKRDEAKFDHVLEVARRLPVLRQRVDADLSTRGLGEPRVLAAVARLLDMGTFRVGGDGPATRDEDPTFGVSTLRPSHLRGSRGCVVLEFPAKGGIEVTRSVSDADVCGVLRELRRRRRDADRLFGYWDGRSWRDVRADDVNAYLREASGGEMTAKDFRTWHGTVEAAVSLAAEGTHRSAVKRKKAVAAVMRSVAELLGNTPTVARASYVDPRVIDLYHDGVVAQVSPSSSRDRQEKAVLELLEEAD